MGDPLSLGVNVVALLAVGFAMTGALTVFGATFSRKLARAGFIAGMTTVCAALYVIVIVL